MSKIIAVWGSPGSGKTTTACKLAYELASKTGKDTALLTNDIIAPSLPVLFPILKKKDMENKSVGRIHAIDRLVGGRIEQLMGDSFHGKARVGVLDELVPFDRQPKAVVHSIADRNNFV